MKLFLLKGAFKVLCCIYLFILEKGLYGMYSNYTGGVHGGIDLDFVIYSLVYGT